MVRSVLSSSVNKFVLNRLFFIYRLFRNEINKYKQVKLLVIFSVYLIYS